MRTKETMKTIVAIALCLLLGLSSYAAENENYKFRPLSPEGGFYYDGVKQIEQDKLGFIWVMMENELYRFDGYQYKKYRPYFNNLLPDKRWIFLNIAVDSTDYLYVNTNNGIFRYDIMKDRQMKLEAFGRILDILDELRVKCPWDRAQTEKIRHTPT